MTGGKIMGVFVITIGVVTIGAEALFIHDWSILILGVVNVVGGVAIILSDNRLIRTRKEAKLARASADEAQQQLQDAIDRVMQEDSPQATIDSLKPVREMLEQLSEEFGVQLKMTPALVDGDTFEVRHLFYHVQDGVTVKLNKHLNKEMFQKQQDSPDQTDVNILDALESALRSELQARLTGTT